MRACEERASNGKPKVNCQVLLKPDVMISAGIVSRSQHWMELSRLLLQTEQALQREEVRTALEAAPQEDPLCKGLLSGAIRENVTASCASGEEGEGKHPGKADLCRVPTAAGPVGKTPSATAWHGSVGAQSVSLSSTSARGAGAEPVGAAPGKGRRGHSTAAAWALRKRDGEPRAWRGGVEK